MSCLPNNLNSHCCAPLNRYVLQLWQSSNKIKQEFWFSELFWLRVQGNIQFVSSTFSTPIVYTPISMSLIKRKATTTVSVGRGWYLSAEINCVPQWSSDFAENKIMYFDSISTEKKKRQRYYGENGGNRYTAQQWNVRLLFPAPYTLFFCEILIK